MCRCSVELTAQVSPLMHSAIRKKLASVRMLAEDPFCLLLFKSLPVDVLLRFQSLLYIPVTFLKARLKQAQLVTSCCLFGCWIIALPEHTQRRRDFGRYHCLLESFKYWRPLDWYRFKNPHQPRASCWSSYFASLWRRECPFRDSPPVETRWLGQRFLLPVWFQSLAWCHLPLLVSQGSSCRCIELWSASTFCDFSIECFVVLSWHLSQPPCSPPYS